MAFVNLSLLLGIALVAIPIFLHLILRQKPERLIFPALRFIQERREANHRKLQLRHWMLLALRCSAIAVLALLLARPSADSARTSNWLLAGGVAMVLVAVIALAIAAILYRRGALLVSALSALALGLLVSLLLVVVDMWRHDDDSVIGDQEAPVAAALVFDTAPRMNYRHHNTTRLEKAQQMGEWLIEQLPALSEVAVVDSQWTNLLFALDLSGARRSIIALDVANEPEPLLDTVQRALSLLQDSPKRRKEIYIFTDLAEVAWETSAPGRYRDSMSSAEGVHIFVIDVGVRKPRNFSLENVSLSSQSVVQNSSLRIETKLVHLGSGGERDVELYLEEPNAPQPLRVDGVLTEPAARLADRAVCRLEADGSQTVAFQIRLVERGTHHGWIKLSGNDGLSADDIRFFTVEVRQPWKILVVYGDGAYPHFLTKALAPLEFRESHKSRFECDTMSSQRWADADLASYAAVCLLDLPPLPAANWEKLSQYVEQGGGLGIFLGRNARPVGAFNEPSARQLLPAMISLVMRRPGGDVYLAPQDLSHPVLAAFRTTETSVPWYASPIYRHWIIDKATANGQVIVAFSNNHPALLERPFGRGRVLMLTTPISDTGNREEPWNRLPIGFEPWPFVILANEMVLHLVASGESRLNYTAGETALLPRGANVDPTRFRLFMPDGAWEDIHLARDAISIRFTDEPGPYRLLSEDGQTRRGFSVNLSSNATDLRRADPTRLDQIFGKKGYQFARTRSEIAREQGEARLGREFYPYLGALLVIILALEYTLANRFYS